MESRRAATNPPTRRLIIPSTCPDRTLTAERDELTKLRRENRQLKLEREILSKAAAWFTQETAPNSKRSTDS